MSEGWSWLTSVALAAVLVAVPGLAVSADVQVIKSDPTRAVEDQVEIALVVAPELRTAKLGSCGLSLVVTQLCMDLGKPIVADAQDMLASLGMHVLEVGAAEKIESAQYYIIPRVVRAEEARGLLATTDFTLALEWKVTDSTGATVLLDTVVGDVSGDPGNGFTYKSHNEALLKQLMAQVFERSRPILQRVLVRR